MGKNEKKCAEKQKKDKKSKINNKMEKKNIW
jgi:hypothetical protein